jgi:hypothetical protein
MLTKSKKFILALIFAFQISAFANESAPPPEHGDEHGGGHEAKPETAAVFEPPPKRDYLPAKEIRITDNAEDIQVPSKVWDILFKDSKSHLLFDNINVLLRDKNSGVLKESPVRIQFPRGGGSIDLSQYTSGKQGSFYVSFEFNSDYPKENLKYFYVSRARKRRVDGEILGSGCNKVLEIHEGLMKLQEKDGLLVNTTRARHVSLLSGSFVFANIQAKDVKIAQISFTDSTHPDLICTGNKLRTHNEPAESL